MANSGICLGRTKRLRSIHWPFTAHCLGYCIHLSVVLSGSMKGGIFRSYDDVGDGARHLHLAGGTAQWIVLYAAWLCMSAGYLWGWKFVYNHLKLEPNSILPFKHKAFFVLFPYMNFIVLSHTTYLWTLCICTRDIYNGLWISVNISPLH